MTIYERKKNKIKISLRSKIIMLVSVMTFLTALSISSFTYMKVVQHTLDSVIKELAGKTRLVTLRFKQPYDEMKNDVLIISHTPPIDGIIRALENNNIDPTDGSSAELWKTRLETIFTSIMESRPYYTQMRYIGVSNGGRELVRVDRKDNLLVSTDPTALQQKEEEPYFKKGIQVEKGHVYFSEVTYNREHGAIDPSYTPTVRAVLPVYSSQHTLFGMIVINASYPSMLKKVFKDITSKKNIFITNDMGDYMAYTDGVLHPFVFHHSDTYKPLDIINDIKKRPKEEGAFINDNYVSYFVKLPVNIDSKYAFLGVLVQVPYDELMADVYKIRNQSLLLMVILTVIAVCIAIIVASWLTKPLNRMTRTLLAAGDNKKDIALPIESNDEIGALARAFKHMIDTVVDSEYQVEAVLENASEGIFTINEQGYIERWNAICRKIFGYTADEMAGKHIDIIMPESDKTIFAQYLGGENAVEDKELKNIRKEVQAKRKDGTIFPMEMSINAFYIEDKKLYAGFVRDITERKKAEKNLKKANQELESFTYIASHDLRSPLINLRGHSEKINKLITKIEPAIESIKEKLSEEEKNSIEEVFKKQLPKSIGFIAAGVDKMDHMTNAILELSRTGRRKLRFVEVDIKKLVDKCVAAMAYQIEEKNVTVIIDQLPQVIADKLAMEQIFSNLIDNALKYLEADRKGEIHVTYEDQVEQYAFIVTDNGRGIDEKDFDKVFAIFRRAGNTMETTGEGMGLNYVRTLIARHGGEISFTSTLNQGTTFIFTISKNIQQTNNEEHDETGE